MTSHGAFNYLAKRYGIDVAGAVIPSQTTQAQPSAGEIARLVDLVQDQRVRAIFPESSINPSRRLPRREGPLRDRRHRPGVASTARHDQLVH